jgi:hypothetical protein
MLEVLQGRNTGKYPWTPSPSFQWAIHVTVPLEFKAQNLLLHYSYCYKGKDEIDHFSILKLGTQ